MIGSGVGLYQVAVGKGLVTQAALNYLKDTVGGIVVGKITGPAVGKASTTAIASIAKELNISEDEAKFCFEAMLTAATAARSGSSSSQSRTTQVGAVQGRQPAGISHASYTRTPSAGSRVFQGLEVRGSHDLGHMDDSTLRAMSKHGFAGTTKSGQKIILHHDQQNPAGPVIDVPKSEHSIGNVTQLPLVILTGVGLTAEQRAHFDEWRLEYWKMRALEELNRRARQCTPKP